MATAEALLANPDPPTVQDLKPGDAVEAIGLTESGMKDLNGQVGVLIKRYSKKNGGRLEVRFTENGKPKIVALDPENSCVPGGAESQKEKARKEKEQVDKANKEKTTRGKYVEVFGLTSEKGQLLNGLRGIVIKKIEATGRVEVCLSPEGNVSSVKPDNLQLVTGASATDLENAKELAFPHIKAANEELFKQQESPHAGAATATATPPPPGQDFGGDFERERSWSPPPETRQAASAAALQAASLASSRGFTPQQAEAYGAQAAERTLVYAKEVAKAQAAAARAQAAAPHPRVVPAVHVVPGMVQGLVPGMVPVIDPRMPGVVRMQAGMVPGMVPGYTQVQAPQMAAAAPLPPPPPSTPREAPTTVEDSKIGDSLEAFGLKGADEALNNDKGTITNILGWSNRKRYVLKFTQFIIDDNGDLAEKERIVTLTPDQLRVPGAEPEDEGDDGEEDDGSESRSRSRRKSRSRRRARKRSM